MKEMETEKFKKFGSSFILTLLGVGFGIPFLISLIMCLTAKGGFRWDVFLPIGLDALKIWISKGLYAEINPIIPPSTSISSLPFLP